MLEQGMSVICVATNLKITMIANYDLVKAAAATLLGSLSQQEGSGEPRKLSWSGRWYQIPTWM